MTLMTLGIMTHEMTLCIKTLDKTVFGNMMLGIMTLGIMTPGI